MLPMIKVQWQRITSNPAKILVFIFLPLILFTVGLQISYSTQADFIYYFVDLDQTPVTALYAEDFSVTPEYTLSTLAEAEEKILDNQAHFAIVIPEGFTASLLEGTPTNIQIYSIKTPDTTVMAEVRVKNLTDHLVALAKAASINSAPDLVSLYRSAFSDGLTYRTEAVALNKVQGMRYGSGFSLMMLAFNCFSIAGILLQDRQQGTLARIRTTPVKPLGQIFSTIIVGGFILLLNVASIALVNYFVFKVSAGPLTYLLLFLGALIFLFLGMYIALTVRRSGAVNSLQTIIIVPTSMLSGAYWPLAMMPDFMQKLAMLTPQYWTVDGIAKLARAGGSASAASAAAGSASAVSGAASSGLLLNFAVLGAFLLLFIVLLAVRLKNMEDTESFS